MTNQQADQARQDKLEELYTLDGRHYRAHPMHALYTGLWVAQSASLSPAAQAVLWAGLNRDSDRLVIAAALRAAADQVVPAVPFDRRYITEERWDARDDIRAELHAIASELEAQS